MGALLLALIFPGPNECVYVSVHMCMCVSWQKCQFPGACTNGLVTPLGV